MASPNYIYFGLAGDFDPELVASEVGIKPTRSAAKHSKNLERKIPRESLLRFAQTHADADGGVLDIYGLAERVVAQLEPFTRQFKDAATKYDAEAMFQVVFYFPISDEISTPIIGFSKRVVQFIAATGASIDIDTYRA